MSQTPIDRQRLREALDDLARHHEAIAAALPRVGYPEPRTREPGFPTLLRIITAQQISTRAAAAIQARLEAAMGGRAEVTALLALTPEELRAAGLSARKAAYAISLAQACADGRLDAVLDGSGDEESVIAALTALPGFGRWSAEIYLLFAMGRIDVLPADDFALQAGFQRLMSLPERPKGRALREATQGWAPWRGAGAIFLWHFYGAATLDEAPRR